MPAPSTVLLWVSNDPALAEQYTRAREMQGDNEFDRIGELADSVIGGEIDPAAARVAIDAIKWRAGKLRPKVYGDKLDLAGNLGVTVNIESKDGDL